MEMLAFWPSKPIAFFRYDVGIMATSKPTSRQVKIGERHTEKWAFVKEWRNRFGLTQEQLGELSGDGKDQISRWEAYLDGHPPPRARILKAQKALELGAAMGLKPAWQIFINPEERPVVLTGEEADGWRSLRDGVIDFELLQRVRSKSGEKALASPQDTKFLPAPKTEDSK